MSAAKKTFDGEFETYYNTIKSHGTASIMEVSSYSPVGNNVDGLYWEGKSQESFKASIQNIDSYCESLHQFIDNLIKKAKIIFKVLYPDLESLKAKIELYNDTIDQIEKTKSLISQEEAKEGSNG